MSAQTVVRPLLVLAAMAAMAAMAAVPQAAAQRVARTSFDVNFGVSTGGGLEGADGERNGLAMDAILSRVVQASEREGRVFAASVSLQAPWTNTLSVCNPGRLAPDVNERGGCGRDDEFPGFFSVALLGGFQRTGEGSARFLAGPAYFNDGDDGRALGLQGRVDLAARATSHVSLMASLRGSVLQFRGSLLYLGAFGVGLRLQ